MIFLITAGLLIVFLFLKLYVVYDDASSLALSVFIVGLLATLSSFLGYLVLNDIVIPNLGSPNFYTLIYTLYHALPPEVATQVVPTVILLLLYAVASFAVESKVIRKTLNVATSERERISPVVTGEFVIGQFSEGEGSLDFLSLKSSADYTATVKKKKKGLLSGGIKITGKKTKLNLKDVLKEVKEIDIETSGGKVEGFDVAEINLDDEELGRLASKFGKNEDLKVELKKDNILLEDSIVDLHRDIHSVEEAYSFALDKLAQKLRQEYSIPMELTNDKNRYKLIAYNDKHKNFWVLRVAFYRDALTTFIFDIFVTKTGDIHIKLSQIT